jgi:iron(III) transport system substrate-binding protein
MKTLFVLGLVSALTLFAACKEETGGSVVIYSPHSEEQVTAILGLFEKESGIKVDLISVGIGEVFKRLKSEINNPYADVAWGGVSSIYVENQDLFESYVSVNDDKFPEQFRNHSGKVTFFCLDGSLLIYNTNLLGSVKIEGYADLLNPALKDKIIMADPAASGSAFAHLINMLCAMGDGDYMSDKGWGYVQALLVNNDGKIAGSSSMVPKSVADGEYGVGISNEDNSINYVKNGAPVKIVYMKEGVHFNAGSMAVVKGTKNLENAKKFVDFITSKQAQDIYGSQTTVRPIRADAQTSEYMTALKEIRILPKDEDYINQHRQEILDRYKTLVTEVRN